MHQMVICLTEMQKTNIFDYTIGANKYRKNGRQIQDLGGYAYIYRPQGCCMMVDLEKMDEVDYMDEHTFYMWKNLFWQSDY